MPKKPKLEEPTVAVSFYVVHDGVDTETIQSEIYDFVVGECKPFLRKLAKKIRSYSEEQDCTVEINLNDLPPLAR
jgi:hypothetical protein